MSYPPLNIGIDHTPTLNAAVLILFKQLSAP